MSGSSHTDSLRRLRRSGAAVGALALLLAGCKGKGAEGGCSGAGSTCGGNPVGTWELVDTCSFPVTSRPAQNYDVTRAYFQPETGATPPAQTSGSWCWDLSFDMDGNVKTPATPQATTGDVVVSGTVTFNADHTYVYSLNARSTIMFHVARSCFGVNGAGTTCADLATKLIASGIGVNPTYKNPDGSPAFRCQDGGEPDVGAAGGGDAASDATDAGSDGG